MSALEALVADARPVDAPEILDLDALPRWSLACLRVMDGSSMRRSLFSERPRTMLPRLGKA